MTTTDATPVRVLIADDQAMVRGSFRVLVDHTAGMTAVGEAANGAEAVELARRERPDVVLMDIRMPDLDGIEATRQICTDPALPGVRVLILTTFDLDEYVYAALRAGAAGFLLKDTPPPPHRHRRRRLRRGAARPLGHPSPDRGVRPPSGACAAAQPLPGRDHRPGA
ncbi:Protein-glutamate methylesterase_protein-glutamine glutaminase [Streptomyces sp. enrichment culture]